jgi:hypothetical protein
VCVKMVSAVVEDDDGYVGQLAHSCSLSCANRGTGAEVKNKEVKNDVCVLHSVQAVCVNSCPHFLCFLIYIFFDTIV